MMKRHMNDFYPNDSLNDYLKSELKKDSLICSYIMAYLYHLITTRHFGETLAPRILGAGRILALLELELHLYLFE